MKWGEWCRGQFLNHVGGQWGGSKVGGRGAQRCLRHYPTDQTFLNFIDFFRKLKKYRDGFPSGSEYSLLREVYDLFLVRSITKNVGNKSVGSEAKWTGSLMIAGAECLRNWPRGSANSSLKNWCRGLCFGSTLLMSSFMYIAMVVMW